MDKLRTYDIRSIPHEEHRYETVGDYWDEGNVTFFRVSQMGDARKEFSVIIHELIEEFLCRQRGIPEPTIKAFDEEYERKRPEGDASEPGDSPDAPYQKEHQFATRIERLVCEEIGLDWDEYTKTVESL